MIVATYTFEKLKPVCICQLCSYYGNGCEIRGRHVDTVKECFMFAEKKEAGKVVK